MRFWLFCLDDVHQILFSTLANLMLDNLWTKTFFVLLLWICAYETKGVTASSLGTTSRTFYLFVLLLRSGKLLRWWQECLLLLRRNPMLDRIWQDHFLTVKMVKQLLLEESYAYQISYILQFFLKCDFQQKQHMSNRYFFQALQLYSLYFKLVHIHIHRKISFCRLALNRKLRFKVWVAHLFNTRQLT